MPLTFKAKFGRKKREWTGLGLSTPEWDAVNSKSAYLGCPFCNFHPRWRKLGHPNDSWPLGCNGRNARTRLCSRCSAARCQVLRTCPRQSTVYVLECVSIKGPKHNFGCIERVLKGGQHQCCPLLETILEESVEGAESMWDPRPPYCSCLRCLMVFALSFTRAKNIDWCFLSGKSSPYPPN